LNYKNIEHDLVSGLYLTTMYALMNKHSDYNFDLLKKFVNLASKTILNKNCRQNDAQKFIDKFDVKSKSMGMRSLKSKHDLSFNKEELISSIQKLDICNYHFDYARIETDFKWKYCNASVQYKRGYSCSLWLIIHTILINSEERL